MNISVKKNPNSMFNLIVSLIVIVVCILGVMNLWENLDADRIMVIQSPIKGTLNWHVTPGIKWQGFGRVTKYYKLDTYEFQIPVRFNDGGHGTIHGSINYELPFDKEHLNSLHMKYGSQVAIQKQLIETVTNKCVYMTGPLMSSKESYAEKRTSLIRYIEEQINYGVFKTTQKDVKTTDPMTGSEKTVTVVEIVMDSSGVPQRQEEAILASYGIKTSNFAVTALPYDETVESQIKQQQAINMKVQTAIASAKEAEQNVITVAKQGEANAATAKWEQEVVKAKAVTLAEQEKEVAKLKMDAAEFTKKEQILLGQGEAERKKLAMGANGALEQKLAAWIRAQEVWADAASKYAGQWVPSTVIGGDGKSNYNGAQTFMDLMGMKAAKDLSLDMSVPNK